MRSWVVTGAITGVLVLAAMVVFAVGLPKWTGDDSGTDLPELPDRVGDLVAIDTFEQGDPERQRELEDSAATTLERVYGEEAVVRTYQSEDGTAQAAIMVIGGDPGLFSPGGPPFDLTLLGFSRGPRELVRADDAICAVEYSQPIPEGQEPPADDRPAQVECQRGADGMTFDVITGGLTVDETVALLDDVIGTAEGH